LPPTTVVYTQCTGLPTAFRCGSLRYAVFFSFITRTYNLPTYATLQRTSIPSDLVSESPDPTQWPTPTAAFPASGCNPRTFFNPQNMILNIDICGAWAGNTDVYGSTGCSGNCTSLVGTASNYDNAYWEIGYVKTYTEAGSTSVSASSSASTSQTGSGSLPTVSQGAAGKTELFGAGVGALVMAAIAAVVA
jgi:hypothetical protein